MSFLIFTAVLDLNTFVYDQNHQSDLSYYCFKLIIFDMILSLDIQNY
jgi:hypothetical protein